MTEVTLYTAQQPIVLETMERDGVSRVKLAYIEKKYGDTAWIFKEAYSFFREWASEILPRPEGAESVIWLYPNSIWCFMTPDSILMTFRIPEEQVLLFDYRIWNRILNLEYIGKDEKDEERFAKELKNIGLNSTHKLFSTAFYPTQKRKVRDSWKTLFTSAEGCPKEYLQAAVWELRKEWLVDVKNA